MYAQVDNFLWKKKEQINRTKSLLRELTQY